METSSRENRLLTHLDMAYFSLTMSFVEESAQAFGMEAADTLRLRLACEEIFTYLAGSDHKGKPVSAEAEDGLYYVGVKFLIQTPHSDFPPFRFAGKKSPDSGDDLSHMGLIIASRFVDRLNVLHDSKSGHGIGLIKEKSYPETKDPVKVRVRPLDRYRITRPETETLKLFARQVTAYYPSHLYPPVFCFPGKVADMVAQGQHHVLVATDGEADVGGGIFFRTLGRRMIEAAGPYVFGQPPEHGMAEALVSQLLMEVAKTSAPCLTDIYATPELPEGYFELLGSIDHVKQDGEKTTRALYYRQLKEDPGLTVWAHPGLVAFLEKEYKRLFLAREIRVTSDEGEARPAHSLFSLHLDRLERSAIARLIWDGADTSAVLGEHLRSLKAEAFSDVFFEIDLAHPWEANLYPILTGHGFTPRLVLPRAGKADVIAFQYEGQ